MNENHAPQNLLVKFNNGKVFRFCEMVLFLTNNSLY